MAQKESKLSREIMDALRLEGWFCFKVHGNEYTMVGLNDIIVCAEGYFIGLETKNPEDRNKEDAHTRSQARVHQKIRDAGGQAVVVCSPEEAIQVVELWLRRRRATPKS